MTHNLEENGEDNESEVGVANKLPAETIKEANLVVHDRRRASLLAERAGTIGDVVITIEDSIGGTGSWHCTASLSSCPGVTPSVEVKLM